MRKKAIWRFLSVPLATVSLTVPAVASTWTYLGIYGAEIRAPTDMFIDWNAIEDLGDNQFLVETLNVHPQMMIGIDFPVETDAMFYFMSAPHRSYVAIEIYDCERRMIATIRRIYYFGERPEKDQLVFDWIEEDPMFYGDIPGLPMKHPALDAVCAPKPLQEFDLLG